MARKGNQQKNGLDRHSSNHKKGVSDSGCALPNAKGRGNVREGNVVAGEELSNGNQPSIPLTECVNKTNHIGDEKKNKLNSDKFLRKENHEMDAKQGLEHSVSSAINPGDCIGNTSTMEASGSSSREANGPSPNGYHGPKYSRSNLDFSSNGLHTEDAMKNLAFSDTVIVRRLRASALSILKAATEWVERQKPQFVTLTTNILNARDYVQRKIEHAYPIVMRWLIHFGNIMLLISMVWLECTLRGIDSFLRMGTTSFFSVIWCSILSLTAMIGVTKFLIVLAIAALVGLLVGFAIAILLTAISGIVFLWFYGSFWTTTLVFFFGGLALMLSHERLALFITTVYSIYCAWTYVGWLGLLLGLNLSFISSDALIFFLKSNVNEHRRPNNPPETAGMRGRPGFFYGEPVHASSSETGSGQSAERSSGVPSTSGTDCEITSEDEVVRLLNCTDHYSALGLSRYENVDVSILKREYRKKAMLVHPDKNMGNEKAAEAFKKLQNAYEVLLDSFKRKAYDDELRREELLNCFRRFQSASQKNGGHGIFASGFTRTEADGEDPLGESRRIACRKCGNFHVWVHTKKSKSRARWCQDCKDFHQAKDGDGWVEQSSQPFFFGILQKVDAPSAYVCADSKIYDATEWYICQGMRCPINTHKPSFHVNTSVTSKHNSGKGTSSGQRGGIPPSNMEESMTEEEFFEWLQNAVQAGVFENFAGGTSSESPSARASKSGGSNSGGGSGSKRKKKGKKQW
uniref:J domain-containing protein n=1 Tax=Davidia involucrata TaxID=16924 RepID=A0A5B7A990_DAVIN